MSEPRQRDRKHEAVKILEHEIDDAAFGTCTGYGVLSDAAEHIIVAAVERAKSELRAELDAGIAARAPQRAAEPARVTCQCRDPEHYADPGDVMCNACGYPVDNDARANLPPRADRRDFGPHLCFCMWIITNDGKTCCQCGGKYLHPVEMPDREVICG